MRSCAWWASVIFFAYAFFTTESAAYTSNDSASDQPPAKISEPWTKSLVKEESYRRDGVIEEMLTCLLVAADDDAYELWSANNHWHNMEPPVLAEALYTLSPGKKEDPGFGTVLACSQILMAWHTSLPSPSLSKPISSIDGRVEHGAIVIDLALDAQGERASIKPLPLVRLLTSPKLLPSWTYGGMIIRNAVVEGTLLLHNLHLSVPLAFVDVKFLGGGYRKDVYKIDSEVQAAISILHSRFQDHILISASEICGDVLINDSQFEEKFDWQNVKQTAINTIEGTADSFAAGCIDSETSALSSGLYIHSSTFRQSLRFSRTRLGTLSAHSNRIGRFLAWQTRFGNAFFLSDNDIGSFQASSHLAKRTAINFNRIKNDFFLFGHSEMQGRIDSIGINSNHIGGGIGLSKFPPDVLPETISLQSNHVGNGSLLCVPRDWRGTLSLDGSSYDGKLAIGLTRRLDPEVENDVLDDDSENLKCSWNSWEPKRFTDSESVYCPDLRSHAFLSEETRTPRQLDAMKVDLKAVEIRTLVWQLPLECTYRWSGFGLDYRLWQPADNAAEILSKHTGHRDLSPLRVFRAWRTTLWSHDPAPLDTMSRYLTENGAYNESRSILLEAKRLNYVSECRPDQWSITCGVNMILNVGERALNAAAALWSTDLSAAESLPPDMTENNESRPLFERLSDQANSIVTSIYNAVGSVFHWLSSLGMLLILWPGGYGAQPERAIVLMAVCVPIFWIIYRYHSYKLVHDLANIPALIEPLRGQSIADELVKNWPDEDTWMKNTKVFHQSASLSNFLGTLIDQWRSMDRRYAESEEIEWLEQVQGPLMSAVEKAEKRLQDGQRSQLATLRHELERFGNTDVLGFSRFDSNKMPTRFTRWQYSVDTMLPVIDLHAYSNYYPISFRMRFASVFQHVIGWWLTTVFIASAAIL